jgi:hypothetical protein
MNAATTPKNMAGSRRRGIASERTTEDRRTSFDVKTLEALAEDLKSGRIPLDRITVTDDQVPNLRAVIRNTGLVSYHVQYSVNGSRPFMKVGNFPDMPIKTARELAHTVTALAAKGIDPQAGLHERLIRELLDRGDKWKP